MNIPYRITLLIAQFTIMVSTWAQSPFDTVFLNEARKIREQVEVFTDREIYAVNEPIFFNAFYRLNNTAQSDDWSRVLYAELISSNASPVVQTKFPITDGICSGKINIPSGVLSGIYYLKCYTKWMRNAGADHYTYVPLKIINPFLPDVIGGENSETIINKAKESGVREMIRITFSQPEIKRFEKVSAELSLSENSNDTYLKCCLSVIPIGSEADGSEVYEMMKPTKDPAQFQVQFLPEINGLSISGKAEYRDQPGTPSEYTRLHFSLLGDHPEYFVCTTDKSGRFALALPELYGPREIFVTPQSDHDEAIQVYIDSEFDDSEIPFYPPRFELTGEEKVAATRIMINMQLKRAYSGAENYMGNAYPDTSSVPFYGTWVNTILLDEFVKLPSMEEVFLNLVPDVFVSKRRNTRSIYIEGQNASLKIFQPLLMIDYIPLPDPEKFLEINPEKIERIDVINEVYMKGNVSFGGIISMHSRKRDMAGADLPEGSYFYDFGTFEPVTPSNLPEYSKGDRVPDTRNTIIWIPGIHLSPGKSHSFNFMAPSMPGRYVVMVKGMTEAGNICISRKYFEVK